MKYMTTHDGYRYLTSEIAIASGRRDIPDAHWEYAATKMISRIERYENVTSEVNFFIAPSKVTCHANSLIEYFENPKLISWGAKLIEKILEKNDSIGFYFNPAVISKKEYFFKNDSHWNCIGALNYFDPWIKARLAIENQYFSELQKSTEKCLGNCISENNRDAYAENYTFLKSNNFNPTFTIREGAVPDFSFLKTKNETSLINERVLIIHSSNYEFARGFFSPLFRETIEVYAPYVDEKTVEIGQFDRVLIITAERNSAVVYDGGIFNENITKALQQDYINRISEKLSNTKVGNDISGKDSEFMKSLAKSWSGYGS